MSLTGNRVESFRAELLTSTDATLGNLEGVSGGHLEWNANANLPAGGSLQLEETDQEVNYSQDRIRLWWKVDDQEWPLGVYVMAAPARKYTASGISRDITLIDKLTVVADDVLTTTLQLPTGANVVNAVVDQIMAAGETRIAATASSTTLSNPMAWEPGTSRLRVINDLLTVANYWALWTDRNGQFRVEPYIAPADRPVVFSFEEGAAAVHSPEWEFTLDLWEATNKVVMVSQANDAGVTMTATATDDNPDSPTSTVSMGRVLNPIVEENVEAATQADLQVQANRKLLDNSNVVGKLAVSHAALPIWYNEAVFFVSQGTSAKVTVTKMSLNLEPGAQISAEWRQV